MSAHNHDEEIIRNNFHGKLGGQQNQGWKPKGGNIKPLTEEDAKCPEITPEKSEAAAMQIRILNTFVFALDEEYLAEAIKQSVQQHSMYDATAVLNRSWTREQSDLLGEQVNALQHLLNYIKSNKRITELRERLHNASEIQRKFQNQFPV